MKQSRSRKAGSCSASSSNFVTQASYSVHKSPLRAPIPNQMKPGQTLTRHNFKIHFSINLQSTLKCLYNTFHI
jgi:hypothetical protein